MLCEAAGLPVVLLMANDGLSQVQQFTWEDATDLTNQLHNGSVFN